MSLDKAIKAGKEKRKVRRGSARFDSSCRNHGKCSYCEGNRTKAFRLAADVSKEALDEAKEHHFDITISDGISTYRYDLPLTDDISIRDIYLVLTDAFGIEAKNGQSIALKK
jgi:hypothetical protein